MLPPTPPPPLTGSALLLIDRPSETFISATKHSRLPPHMAGRTSTTRIAALAPSLTNHLQEGRRTGVLAAGSTGSTNRQTAMRAARAVGAVVGRRDAARVAKGLAVNGVRGACGDAIRRPHRRDDMAAASLWGAPQPVDARRQLPSLTTAAPAAPVARGGGGGSAAGGWRGATRAAPTADPSARPSSPLPAQRRLADPPRRGASPRRHCPCRCRLSLLRDGPIQLLQQGAVPPL